ncbi:hypothetical protein M426DRAFT_324547 [Hypoxylon sp. CI-4A]|nr:hypothetical protein M426DRAFT_324547 [Hypoxylon sp. CI-4A]
MSRKSSSDSTPMEKFPSIPDISASQLSVPDPVAVVDRSSNVSPMSQSRARFQDPMHIDTQIPWNRTQSPISPNAGIPRRMTRSNTFRTVEEFEEFGKPGAEPGIDPAKPDGGQENVSDLHAQCQISVFDFSHKYLETNELDNAQLIEFIKKPQPSWVKCRWINVNSLSWDVIQALGQHKNLHRLSIEDLIRKDTRTKVEWFPNNAFINLTCMKLLSRPDEQSSDEESDDSDDDGESINSNKSHASTKRAARKFKKWFTKTKSEHPTVASMLESGTQAQSKATSLLSDFINIETQSTLQRYHNSSNSVRTEYMEKHSPLTFRGKGVLAEQVAIFITSDNTVIAFFEHSADDIEVPMLRRLADPTTLLRRSCDASMIVQAIIDTIIDLALPITACYADVVGDLELDVLTKPSIKHTNNLYIIISELNKMSTLVDPFRTVINQLREHRTKLPQEDVVKKLQDPLEGVIITPMAHVYLGEVYDNFVLVSEKLQQIRGTADQLIQLIFNTISANQNENMTKLTNVTIVGLPLTVLTGYFGQNFDTGLFPTESNVSLFWKIAVPVTVAFILFLQRGIIIDWVTRSYQRRHIVNIREKHEKIRRKKRNKPVGPGK